MTTIRVFYEDQAAGPIKGFGPHQLLCACVADHFESQTLWDLLHRIDGQPKKGDNKLLEACRRHAARDRDEIIFALFDGDQIHRVLKLPKGSSPATTQTAISEQIDSPKVRVFMLEGNTEVLVHAAADCLQPPLQGPIPKRPNERDRILSRAATHDVSSVRDCITARVPSFGKLAAAVAETVSNNP